jgi:hypothetical protein
MQRTLTDGRAAARKLNGASRRGLVTGGLVRQNSGRLRALGHRWPTFCPSSTRNASLACWLARYRESPPSRSRTGQEGRESGAIY